MTIHRALQGNRCWLTRGLLMALLVGAGAEAVAREIEANVVSVVDGDTLTGVVKGQPVTVELKHVDAPELAQPFGREARAYLVERLAKSGKIFLEVAKQDDNKKSFKALVYDAQGKCLNFELLKNGLAWYVGSREATKETYYIYLQEKRARTERLGLWSQKSPEAPWAWVARQKTAATTAKLAVTATEERKPQKAAQTETHVAVQRSTENAPVKTPEQKAAATSTVRTATARSADTQPVPPAGATPRNAQDRTAVAVAEAGAAEQGPAESVAVSTAPEPRSLVGGDSRAPAVTKTATPDRFWAGLGTSLTIVVAIALLLVVTITTLPGRLLSTLRALQLERKVGRRTLIPFVIVGAVANADDSLKTAELEAIGRFCDYLALDETDRGRAMEIVRTSKADLATLKCLLNRYLAKSGGNRDLIEAMLLVCFVVASADGIFSAEEQIYLALVCGCCGIEYENYAEKFMPEGGNSALETLGIEPQATPQEQDSKMRHLQRAYNPAALRKLGLTAGELAFALDRYRAIEEAIAAVRKQRLSP